MLGQSQTNSVQVFALLIALTFGSVAIASEGLPLQRDIVLDETVVLGRVTDVAIDSSGNIYVLDAGFHKIHVFDEDGTFLSDMGREGEGPAEFRSPSCLAIDDQDRIYVAGRSDRIVAMDRNGMSLGSISRTMSYPIRSMRCGDDGSVFVCYMDVVKQTIIHKYTDPLGEPTLTASFCDSYAVGRDIDTQIERVYGGGFIDIGDNGHIYYVQMAPQLVRIFEQDGDLVEEHEVRFAESPWPPEPDLTRSRVVFTAPPMATCVVALSDKRFLTTQVYVSEEETYWLTDVHDADGRLLCTDRRDERFSVLCADNEDRLYVVEETESDFRVVRYRLGPIPDAMSATEARN